MSKYKSLEVWKKSMLLVKEVYQLTGSFPKEEVYGLTSQIRRAAVSVPSNIAEGLGRNHKKETIQFLHIARGSMYELDTQLCIAVMVNMMNENILTDFQLKMKESYKLINGMINYYEKANLK